MAHIDDVPAAVTGAGQDFNYTGPNLASLILVNAPLDPAHTNSGLNPFTYDLYFEAEIAAGRAFQGTLNMTDPEHDLQLPMSYAEASGYNYGRLIINGRKWYVFYTAHRINATVSRFSATLDSWPSWDWVLGYSMVDRGHAGVAVSQGDTYGDQYCTTPEPITAAPVQGVMSAGVLSSNPDDWTVMVISANDLRGNSTGTPYFQRHVKESDIANSATFAHEAATGPLNGDHGFTINLMQADYPWHPPIGETGSFQIYVPHVTPSPVSTIDGVTAGGGVYLFTVGGFADWLSVMQGASWIIEGIADIRLVPNWAVGGGGGGSYSGFLPPTNPTNAAWDAAAAIPVFAAQVTTAETSQVVLAGWRDSYLASMGAQSYRKLITSQFMQVVVGNGESTATYQPDQMRSSGVNLHATTGAAHGEDSIRLTAEYNDLDTQMGVTMPIGGKAGTMASGYSRAAANTASADLGPVNTAYSTFAQRQVLDKQQSLAVELTTTQNQMNMGISGVQSVLNAGTGAAMAGMMGAGPGGAAAGALLGGGAALVTAGISANNSLDILDISKDGSIDIATYQLGSSGAFTVMSFDSWAQGMKSVSGRGAASRLASAWRAVSGQAFNVIIAAPSPDRVRELLSTWKRYGYMIGRAFTPSRLDVMTRFSYWKTTDTTIRGAMPQEARQQVAEAFERGVTVWNNISLIGTDQTGDNIPVPGAYY